MNIAKISLGGDWKMRQCADGAEYDAKVPGTVLSVLLEQRANCCKRRMWSSYARDLIR